MDKLHFDGQWSEEALNILPRVIKEQLSLVSLVELEAHIDQLIWFGSSNSMFSVNTTYNLINDFSHNSIIWNQF